MGDTYTHGHHASVLRSHTWRTAENSAAYLLGSLAPGQRLLEGVAHEHDDIGLLKLLAVHVDDFRGEPSPGLEAQGAQGT